MPILYNQTFSGETPGNFPPTGFTDDLGLFHGVVVDFSTMTGNSPAPGFFQNVGKGYQMGLSAGLQHLDGLAAATTMSAWVIGSGLDRSCPRLSNTDGTHTTDLVWAQVENNGSISIYVNSTYGQTFAGSHLLQNSGTQVIHDLTWQYIQMNASFSALSGTGTDTNNYVHVDGTVLIDGKKQVFGSILTNQRVDTMPTPDPNGRPNAWLYEPTGPGGGGWIGELFAAGAIWTGSGTNTSEPVDYYFPNPGNPSVFWSQAVVEDVRRSALSERTVRMTQGAVELVKAPASGDRAVRVSQTVVEIVRRRGGSGWLIYEA